MSVDRGTGISRRQVFQMAAAGVAVWPTGLHATGGEFWNKKVPADWSHDEIDRLITKSPWAKPVKAQYAAGWPPTPTDYPGTPGTGTGTGSSGRYPTGGSYPGGGYPGGGSSGGTGRSGGGIGIPGIGGLSIPGLGGRSRGNGGAASPYEGTVRWDSARPVLDAMRTPLSEELEGRYVIRVSGIPLLGGRSTSSSGEEDGTVWRKKELEDLEELKALTSLQVKGRELVQAGVAARQIGIGNSFLFGFSRELLTIGAQDAEVLFHTQLGRLLVKASFVPKEMLYHGELAV
ncbi:MAG: hypothetical protein ABI759_14900 [Candidatus Solibacter sp.]